MKQTKQFLRPLLMAIVMTVGMLVPQGAWAEDLEVDNETRTISSNESYEFIEVYPGGVLIINEGVTLTVTEGLNIDNYGTVINYGTIIGEGYINMGGGVLANHGHIYMDAGGNGTFYNTGTFGENIDFTLTECNHASYENLGPVDATCTHGAGTQFKCYTCHYIGVIETGEPSPHDNHDHNGLMVCSMCGQLTFDAPTGDGTVETPYQIANAGHLFWFADKVNNDYDNFKDANAVLTADIVVNDGTFAADGTFTATGASEPSTPIEWLVIARFVTYSHGYRGTFDGQGHTISGLYANYAKSGLVGMSSGECKIKNVGVINSYFASIEDVGGICGDAGNNTEISNCYSNNVICKGPYVGGILGYKTNNGVSIVNCYSTASLIGTEDWAQIGGIAGASGSTTNCYTSYGNVNGWCETEINCEANVSLERFASGEIAYKLNGSQDAGTWRQKLSGEGVNTNPVLKQTDDNKVYYGYANCAATEKTYANSALHATQGHNFTNKTEWATSELTGVYVCDHGCGTLSTDDPTYTRMMKNQWGTVVVPFDVSANEEEYDLYSIISVDDEQLTLTKVNGTLSAGTPVLIRMSEAGKDPETGKYNLFLKAANTTLKTTITNPAAVDGYTLKGSYAVAEVADNDYIISNNAFWKASGLKDNDNLWKDKDGNTMASDKRHVYCSPFRAYLASSTSNNAKMLSIGWNEDEDITAVETLDALTSDEAQYFDINGRKLNDLQKGINIVKRGNKTYKIIVK